MSEKEIVIDILPDGTVKIDMKCFKGTSCEDVIKQITKHIGTVVETQKKPDYYEEDETKARIAEEE